MNTKEKQVAKVYKALMVDQTTHYKVVVEAKKEGVTVDAYINTLIINFKKN